MTKGELKFNERYTLTFLSKEEYKAATNYARQEARKAKILWMLAEVEAGRLEYSEDVRKEEQWMRARDTRLYNTGKQARSRQKEALDAQSKGEDLTEVQESRAAALKRRQALDRQQSRERLLHDPVLKKQIYLARDKSEHKKPPGRPAGHITRKKADSGLPKLPNKDDQFGEDYDDGQSSSGSAGEGHPTSN